MNFKERAEKAGYEIQVERLSASYGLASKLFVEGLHEGFILGAEWGFRQAVEMLRDCPTLDGDPYLQTLIKMKADDWADWLLEKARLK